MVSVSAYAVISECSDGSEAASDDSGSCGHNVTYVFDSSTGTLTISGSGDMHSYSFTIDAPWYTYRSYVKKVVIEDGVTSIGDWAFCDCYLLVSVTVPDSVTSIGDYAFRGCSSLVSVTVPDSVTSIGSGAFRNCNRLGEIVIEGNVTSIGQYTFDGCTSLVSVTIPDSVTSIGYGAFDGCSSLTSIVVAEGNTAYCSVDGVLFSKDMKTLLQYPAGRSDDSYIILDSVTSIGRRAFDGCTSLVSVTIPNSVTSIGPSAFSRCISLASVTIPDSVTFIDSYAFYGCIAFVSIILPDSVTSIGDYAFSVCTSLASVTIPDSVISIGDCAFRDCTRLEEIVIGNSVTSIGDYAFCKCKSLISIILPDSVTSIGQFAFYGCTSLASVTIPDSVISIGSWAFDECTSLVSVVIGNSVTSLDRDAFSGCTGLREITIPISVNAVGSNSYPAFRGCTNIEKVTFTPGTGKGYDYGDASSYYNNYYGYTPWYYSRAVLKEVAIEDGVTSIGSYAFYECTGLRELTIPDSVTSIGDWAFSGCSSLASVTIPDSVTSIGSYAFSGCTDVSSIRIGPDVSSIGFMAFGDIVFYDRDAVSVLSSDADSLKGGCFVKTDDRMVKVDGHMMSFYVDGKVVYRGVFVEGDDDTPIPDVPFRPGYICSWEEFELGTEDISVNAVYVLRELTVSFDPNGGSGSMDPVTTDVEHPFLRPENGFSAPDHMHFAGWAYSPDGEPIDFDGLHMVDDAVLYALWAWDQYDVVYKVDGEIVFTDTFGYGTEVTVRDVFQKTGYTVTEWSTDDTEVSDSKFVLGASDVTFSAVSAVNKYSYTVEYVDGDGNTLADPVCGTADYGSTVDAEIKTITGYASPSGISHVVISEDESKNVVTYVYTIIVYTITFDDGTVQTDVTYTVKDSSVDEPQITKKKGHTAFWEEYVLDLTDKTVKAVYAAESYHVEFVSDGIVFFAYDLEYGKEITLPSGTPSKDADVRYVYTFSGWDGYTDGTVLGDGDVTFTAVFEGTLRTYSVTFYDYDGSVISSEDIGYGLPITVPEPVRESTAAYDYAFSGWTDTEGNDVDVPGIVLGDMGFHAVYTETLRQYSVSFLVDGVSYAAYVLPYGDRPVLPGAPSKDPDGFYTYTFSGWDGYTEDMTVEGDRIFTALFSRSVIANTGEDGGYEVKADGEGAPFSSETISGIVDGASADPSVTMSVSVGDTLVSFDNEALRSLHGEDADLLVSRLSYGQMTQAVRDVVGHNVAYSISFGPNRDFGNGTVTVIVPYVLAEWKDPNGLFVYYVAEDGTVEKIPCTYSEGYVTFSTDHFSVYAVMYEAVMYEEPSSDGGPSDSMTVFAVIGIVIAVGAVGVGAMMFVKKKRA